MALPKSALIKLIEDACDAAGITKEGFADNTAVQAVFQHVFAAIPAPKAAPSSGRKNTFSTFAGAMSKTDGDAGRAAIDATMPGGISLGTDGTEKYKAILDGNDSLARHYDSITDAYKALSDAGANSFCAAGAVWRYLGKDGQTAALNAIGGGASDVPLTAAPSTGARTASASKKNGHNVIKSAFSAFADHTPLATWLTDNDLKPFTGGNRMWKGVNDDLHAEWHALAATVAPLPKGKTEKNAALNAHKTEFLELIDRSLDAYSESVATKA